MTAMSELIAETVQQKLSRKDALDYLVSRVKEHPELLDKMVRSGCSEALRDLWRNHNHTIRHPAPSQAIVKKVDHVRAVAKRLDYKNTVTALAEIHMNSTLNGGTLRMRDARRMDLILAANAHRKQGQGHFTGAMFCEIVASQLDDAKQTVQERFTEQQLVMIHEHAANNSLRAVEQVKLIAAE